MSLFRRARSAEAAARPRRVNSGLLRRERRALLEARESRIHDLGGLAAELYRYRAWRSDLIEERCAEIAGIDARLLEIDALLGGVEPERCRCGAALPPNASHCPACGRPQGHPGQAALEATAFLSPTAPEE